MERSRNTRTDDFEQLFSELLAAVAQEGVLRSVQASPVELIEMKDRLHALRSDLAISRNLLTLEARGVSATEEASLEGCDCVPIAAGQHSRSGRKAA